MLVFTESYVYHVWLKDQRIKVEGSRKRVRPKRKHIECRKMDVDEILCEDNSVINGEEEDVLLPPS